MRIRNGVRECFICGAKLRIHCKIGRCRKHGRGTFDKETGRCLKCGKVVEVSLRGHHATSKCETIDPWNKGKTKEDTPSLMKMSKNAKGKKHPGVGEKIKARMKIPEVKEKYRAGWSRGQKKRFERIEEREKSTARTMELIAVGKIIPFGGRKHGNGNPPTKEEMEMLHRLQAYGFVLNHVVPTGTKSPLPTHYKLDLAHVDMMLAVEVDGSSHFIKERRESDERKDEFLQSKGWRVLRFRVPFDFNDAAQTCIGLVSRSSSKRITSRRRTGSMSRAEH